ncbi:sensor histidine kinase [Flavobacterium rivuli]|nr:ATP-binding protein [Flavobacterium rivuli]
MEYQREDVVALMKFEDLLTVGSRIFFQTHFFPMIKMQGFAEEVFLSFKTSNGNDFPVLLNVNLANKGESFEMNFGGMKISNRNKFEKEILEAKNAAESALLENAELSEMRNTLLDNQRQLSRQVEELADRNQQITQINKILSHDLQEPLRKISFFSHKIMADYEDTIDTAAKNNLEKITGLIDKSRSLLEGLERYNSLETKKLTYSEINLFDVVKSAEKQIDVTDQQRGYDIIINKHLNFKADSTLIRHLFLELLSNSIKFAKPKQQLLIKIDAEIIAQNTLKASGQYLYEDFARITFEDNGSGFRQEGTKVFEIFRKAHVQEKAIGIGLAYCKKIMQRHNGSITVDSEEGVGTIFTILLPVISKQ